MTGDFSRKTFNPENHYSAVYLEQGRLNTDADFIEQADIIHHWRTTTNKDVIGPCGCPIDNAGFGITAVTDGNGNPNLRISSGRMYVDGILCEKDERGLFTEQPDLPGAVLPEEDGTYLAYLDVWERHLSYLQAPQTLDPALNGIDTATRKQVIGQVKLLRGTPPFEADRSLEVISAAFTRLQVLFAESVNEALGADPSAASFIQSMLLTIDNFLNDFQDIPPESQRAEIQILLTSIRDSFSTLVASGTNVGSELQTLIEEELERISEASLSGTANCSSNFPEWNELVAPSTGMLNARTNPGQQEEGPCIIPDSAGYSCLGNQLYRVEIHSVDSDGLVFFKWSRDNFSIATSIEAISGNVITVSSLGKDATLGLSTGNWIEIVDDRIHLANQVGFLAQIIEVDPDLREITINPQSFRLLDNQDGDPANDSVPVAFQDGLNPDFHPIIRRCDQSGGQATENGVAVTAFDEWINLECGIQIQFSEGDYNPGDGWCFPARAATNDIEWPRNEDGEPLFQLPEAIHHHYCRLALVQIEDSEMTVLSDCRRFFAPLAESSATNAMHITDLSWIHSNFLNVNLLTSPITITLDDIPLESTLTPQTLKVEVELPFGEGDQLQLSDVSLILDGEISTQSNIIQWQIEPEQLQVLRFLLGAEEPSGDPIQPLDLRILDEERVFLTPIQPSDPRFVVREVGEEDAFFSFPVLITVKGHFIRNGSGLHLDGQVFGSNPDDSGQSIELPSGDNQRASTFHSWFYITMMAIRNMDFPLNAVTGGQSISGTVFMNSPAPPEGVNVQLSSSNPKVAQVPSTILVPAGATEQSFQVQTSQPRSQTAVEITASFAGLGAQQIIRVDPFDFIF
jgi:hypothetical protein